MYKTKKEIEKWIEAFNPEQVERMRADNYLDYIDEDNLNGGERCRGGGEWSVELFFLQHFFIYSPNGNVFVG